MENKGLGINPNFRSLLEGLDNGTEIRPLLQ